MVSSGMLRRVALVRTGVSEEPSASFIRVIIICELGTTQAPHLSSQKLGGPVPDPLLLRKCGSAGNRTRDLWVSSQEL
jgi:hypothetical protein